MSLNFEKLETPAGIGKFNGSLATKSYLEGFTPSKLDAHWFAEVSKYYAHGPDAKFAHARRWFNHISSYSEAERESWTAAAEGGAKSSKEVHVHKEEPKKEEPIKETKKEEKNEEDMDDLFDAVEEPEEKKPEAQKPPPPKKKADKVEKSNVIFDVKPTERETDMALMEEKVRAIAMEGLFWGPSKLVEVAYGVKKLQITCVVEDEKVMMDDLEEKIMEFTDLVQSVDIASMVRAG